MYVVIFFTKFKFSYLSVLFYPKESITSPIKNINDGSPKPVIPAAIQPVYKSILSLDVAS